MNATLKFIVEGETADDAARELAASIKNQLRHDGERSVWQKWLRVKPNRLVPALVGAAAILVATFSWLSLEELNESSVVQTVSNGNAEEQMIVENLDVLNNLELLESMEDLRKLVQSVDSPELSSPIQKRKMVTV